MEFAFYSNQVRVFNGHLPERRRMVANGCLERRRMLLDCCLERRRTVVSCGCSILFFLFNLETAFSKQLHQRWLSQKPSLNIQKVDFQRQISEAVAIVRQFNKKLFSKPIVDAPTHEPCSKSNGQELWSLHLDKKYNKVEKSKYYKIQNKTYNLC